VTPLLNVTKVLGGARIYQRKEGGPWQFDYFVENGEGRIRQSLKTTDKAFATREAERLTLEAKSAVAAGTRVVAGSLGECADAYELHQQDRLRRGEIRSTENVRYKTSFVRKTCSHLFGLDRSIASLTQKDWDRFIPWRLDECQAELETVRQECSLIRGFCNFSRHYGCKVIPELKVFVPKSKRARRSQTFSLDEMASLRSALDDYIKPDTEDGLYLRSWSLGSAKARNKSPKLIQQDLEKSRRELLRWFVLISCLAGTRPHELTGENPEASLRWSDVTVKTQVLEPGRAAVLAILKVREMTKTGERTIPTTAGFLFEQLRSWTRFSDENDYVFADQYGIRAGKPVYLDALRWHWNQVISRMGFTRFKPDLYSMRHYFATRRLASGAPPALVAKSLGHSLTELMTVYEHVLMEEESVIRQVWQTSTPSSLKKMGIIIPDSSELAEPFS